MESVDSKFFQCHVLLFLAVAWNLAVRSHVGDVHVQSATVTAAICIFSSSQQDSDIFVNISFPKMEPLVRSLCSDFQLKHHFFHFFSIRPEGLAALKQHVHKLYQTGTQHKPLTSFKSPTQSSSTRRWNFRPWWSQGSTFRCSTWSGWLLPIRWA